MLHQTGMASGRRIIKVEATNEETQEKVLMGSSRLAITGDGRGGREGLGSLGGGGSVCGERS